MTDLPFADDEACAAAIARIGAIDRDLAVIEATKSETIAKAASIAEKAAEPLFNERAEHFAAVKAYCEANRTRLTDGNRSKTATFTTGSAAWKLGRPRVNIDPALREKIIATLKKRGLGELVRTKEDLDITAIGKAKDKVKTVKGITFVPAEESFDVAPVAAELAPRL